MEGRQKSTGDHRGQTLNFTIGHLHPADSAVTPIWKSRLVSKYRNDGKPHTGFYLKLYLYVKFFGFVIKTT